MKSIVLYAIKSLSFNRYDLMHLILLYIITICISCFFHRLAQSFLVVYFRDCLAKIQKMKSIVRSRQLTVEAFESRSKRSTNSTKEMLLRERDMQSNIIAMQKEAQLESIETRYRNSLRDIRRTCTSININK